MFNNRVFAVLKRELRERVMTKSFIIGTLALPFIMVLIFGFQYLMISMEGDSGTSIVMVSEIDDVMQGLKTEFSKKEWVKNGNYILTYQTMSEADFETYLDEHKSDILDKKVTGILFIPASAMQDKQVKYYSKSTKNITLEERVGRVINRVFIDNYFKDKGISQSDIRFARINVDFNTFRVTKDEGFQKESGGNLALSYIFSFLLYISLLMMGTWMMNSVIEEKTNRVCEVILSSVNARELMTGKILGTALTGLLQMVVWLTPIVVVIFFELPVLPRGFIVNLEFWQVIYFLLNFFVGLITYLGLFATVGAIFNTPQEAQSGVTPLMMLIIIPFLITISMIKNPANTLAEVASLLPFAAIIVMPARMTVTDVPLWQFILSFIVNIGTILAIFPFAGKIYRIGILRTGKKPKLKEVIKWIKFQY
ncbi:MAG: ABC transporter permease [Candidatus Aminicenantes bacterium]|nr:ABC transporter permease [Candidatus Aminicenantes bacterium]